MPAHLLEHGACHSWDGGVCGQNCKHCRDLGGTLGTHHTKFRGMAAQSIDRLGTLRAKLGQWRGAAADFKDAASRHVLLEDAVTVAERIAMLADIGLAALEAIGHGHPFSQADKESWQALAAKLAVDKRACETVLSSFTQAWAPAIC